MAPANAVDEPPLPVFQPMDNVPTIVPPADASINFPTPNVPTSVKPSTAPPVSKPSSKTSDNVSKPPEIDYGPWMARCQRKAKKNWNPPKGTVTRPVSMVLKVFSNGYIGDLRVEKSSGDLSYDEAALSAVRNSVPFEALPAGSPASVNIQLNLDYNVNTSRTESTSVSDLKTRVCNLSSQILANLDLKNWNEVASDSMTLAVLVPGWSQHHLAVSYMRYYALRQKGDHTASSVKEALTGQTFKTDTILRYSYHDANAAAYESGLVEPPEGQVVTVNGVQMIKSPEYETVSWDSDDPRCFMKSKASLEQLLRNSGK